MCPNSYRNISASHSLSAFALAPLFTMSVTLSWVTSTFTFWRQTAFKWLDFSHRKSCFEVHSCWNRYLKVSPDNQPGVLLPSPAGQVTTPLRVRLAGVDLTPEGREWLAETLRTDETVWLRLISRQDESLHCLVSLGGVRLRVNTHHWLMTSSHAQKHTTIFSASQESLVHLSHYRRLNKAINTKKSQIFLFF